MYHLLCALTWSNQYALPSSFTTSLNTITQQSKLRSCYVKHITVQLLQISKCIPLFSFFICFPPIFIHISINPIKTYSFYYSSSHFYISTSFHINLYNIINGSELLFPSPSPSSQVLNYYSRITSSILSHPIQLSCPSSLILYLFSSSSQFPA